METPDNVILPPRIPKHHGRRRWTIIAGAALGALVVASVPICLRVFVVQPFRVPTNTMAPTIQGVTKLANGRTQVGDHIFVDKLSYRLRAPRRGEIVVFRTDRLKLLPKSALGKYYVKRIVGLPGERVGIRPPFVYVNNQRITEPRILATIANGDRGYGGFLLPDCFGVVKPLLCAETNSVQLGKDEYFVLGDNQIASLDSRYWGAVPRKSIVGRVIAIYWPPERAGIPFAG